MDTYYIKLGKKLRELRERRNMTLVEVSEQLGITHKAIANYETGERKIPHPTLIKLCDIYNYDIATLITESIEYLK